MATSVRTYGFGSAEKLADALEPWQGGRAQVLGFSGTNHWLDIWLTKPAEDWIRGEPLEKIGCPSGFDSAYSFNGAIRSTGTSLSSNRAQA